MGKKQTGFTIVELLIVIVVIAVLAAITVVAYNGIQNRAHDTAIKSDLHNIAKKLETYRVLTGSYTTTEAQLSTMTDALGNVVADAVPKASYDAYDVTSPSAVGDTTSRNLLICVRGGTDPKFGIASFSKSKTVWFYTSDDGLSQSPDPWVGQQSTTCPRLGIALTDPGYHRYFFYQRPDSDPVLNNGWRGWANIP